ncbi:hypothetical protein MVEN_02545500 [Mycena venus]|uniref:Uncharacterized protein n=1 Tax=Mycena venus TaxID=2733690 RepID=A0A8H6U2R7_9AGAR|nr:hypothetical protein MVEN_02545500 [Mycena venus]
MNAVLLVSWKFLKPSPKALIPQPFASALDIRSGPTGPDLVTIVSKVSFVVLASRQAQPLVVKWKAV